MIKMIKNVKVNPSKVMLCIPIFVTGHWTIDSYISDKKINLKDTALQLFYFTFENFTCRTN